jgi:flavin reductase (DIM6/NTAB) family NADH-FMN oxidoreductase RutF
MAMLTVSRTALQFFEWVEEPHAMKNLALSKVYQLLEPGPVVLLTTARKGHANVMTMSWHMMVEFEPPLIACVVSNANFSFTALLATKECVIAIPAHRLSWKSATVRVRT